MNEPMNAESENRPVTPARSKKRRFWPKVISSLTIAGLIIYAVFWLPRHFEQDPLNRLRQATDAESDFDIGFSHYKGIGVPVDMTEAVKWFRKAAEQGHAAAQCFLAFCYRKGEGVSVDKRKAVEWYRKAAEQGDAAAQLALGSCYDKGEGVPVDKTEAVKWWRKAADQDNAVAQLNLGYCYFMGDGVPVDKTEAVKWWRKAADQDDAVAQCNLGDCYFRGDGVPADKTEAVKWYRKAAEQGNAKAQNALGNVYYVGEGVPVDKIEAAKWLRKAADQGFADAKKALDKFGTISETLKSPKIKGFYLGMDIEEAAEIWKKYVPEEGRAHSIIEKKEEEGYCLELTIGQGYRSVGCVYADLNEEVTAFHFYTSGVDILFNSPGLKPSDFVEQFANAYNVPMQHSYDARGVYWEYRSPDGVKIVIRRQLVGLYDDIEAVSLSITKGKSEQEIKQSFD